MTTHYLELFHRQMAIPDSLLELPGGRGTLELLEEAYPEQLVFHGSPVRIADNEALEPRQMTWRVFNKEGRLVKRCSDGPPAVCADASFTIPMFIALFKENSVAKSGYKNLASNKVRFYVDEKGIKNPDIIAYVYVFRRDNHFAYERMPVPPGWHLPDGTRPMIILS